MSVSPFAEAIPNLAGAAMLLCGLVLLIRRRRDTAARLVAWQGGLLGLAAASAAWGGGAPGAGPLLWPLAIGALAGRALLLPGLLRLATERPDGDAPPRSGGDDSSRDDGDAFPVAGSDASFPHGRDAFPGGRADAFPRADRAGRPVLGAAASLLVGGGLAVLAVAAVVPAGAGVAPGQREGLALALAVLLAGLLAMLVRWGAAFGLLGLVAAENGALLALVHAGSVLPGAAALAVLSPGLVACAALAARGGRGLSARSLLRAVRR